MSTDEDYLTELENTPDYATGELVDALDRVVKAIGEYAVPEGKETDLDPLVKKLASIAAIPKAIEGLQNCIDRIATAIASIKPGDLGELIKAVTAVAKSNHDVAKALMAEKQIMVDDDDNIVGVRPVRAN